MKHGDVSGRGARAKLFGVDLQRELVIFLMASPFTSTSRLVRCRSPGPSAGRLLPPGLVAQRNGGLRMEDKDEALSSPASNRTWRLGQLEEIRLSFSFRATSLRRIEPKAQVVTVI